MKPEQVAEIHNYSIRLKKALIDQDIVALQAAAQDVFAAGYELEDMRVLSIVRKSIESALSASGWAPRLTKGMN